MSPRRMADYLAAYWGSPAPLTTRPPVCRLLDMKYAPDEQCTLLYQWGEELLIGSYQWPAAQQSPAPQARRLAPLEMWLYSFCQDPALPGLQAVLDGPTLLAALQAALPHRPSRANELVRCQAIPLRYRPGKRCTLQIDLVVRHHVTGRLQRARLYGKLYHHADKAQAVHTEMQLLHAVTTATASPLRLAEAVTFLPELGLVVQAPVAGEPLEQQLYQPERVGRAGQGQLMHSLGRAAHALAALHEIELVTARLRPATADLSKLGRRAAKVAAVAPHFGAALEQLAARLCAQVPTTPAADLRIGHGDCKPSQFLLTPAQVVLLDFDHCGMADPAADVSLFLATLRQSALRLHTKAVHRRQGATWASTPAERHFLAAYMAARTTPADFEARVAWYMALALLRKAWRGFARSPWSPLPDLLVQEALTMIN